MKKHWRNLVYVIEHKKNVFIEGRKLGLGIWQLLKHDLSKFSLIEWFGYANFFFNPPYGVHYKNKEDKLFSNRVKNQKIRAAFNLAWLNHKHKNKHHWQYWLDIKDKKIVAIKMPKRYMLEMLADWNAVSRKFHPDKPRREATFERYQEQTDIILHNRTRFTVENYLKTGKIIY